MSVEEIDLGIDYKAIARKVIDNRANWIDRSNLFYTFGAAAYIDNCMEYFVYLKRSNKILKKEFGDLIDKLCDHFSAKTHPEIALPGFHIFDYRGNGIDASIHLDTPYKKLPIYSEDFENPRSFTILIQKPNCGAGLNVWGEDGVKNCVDYKLGNMYTHSCGLLHQIANTGNMEKNELRITIQGHLITIKGETYIYF